MEPVDDTVDHVRGGPQGPLSRVRRLRVPVESQLADGVQFAFRHFPLAQIHPHALAASATAEAAAVQGRFWGMHALLFHPTGLATGEILGTPTLFIDGVVHRGPHDAATLLQEVTNS